MDPVKVWVCRENGRWRFEWIDPLTGRRKRKWADTPGNKKKAVAEKEAAFFAAEVTHGIAGGDADAPWDLVKQIFYDEYLPGVRPRTQEHYLQVLTKVEKVMGPPRMRYITTPWISRFKTELRRAGLRPATVIKHLAGLRVFVRWAHSQGYLRELPKFPKLGATEAGGRALTGEEVERMIAAVDKVIVNRKLIERTEKDPKKVAELIADATRRAEGWKDLIRGLDLSGLRISEALNLWWAPPATKQSVPPIVLLLELDRPMIHFTDPGSQKNKRRGYCPVTPDFYAFLMERREPRGRVFQPMTRKGPASREVAGRTLSEIGTLSGIITDVETGRTASAHDLRRTFGTRWATRLKPQELQTLMRHSSLATTLRYYATDLADATAETLWVSFSVPS